MKKVQTKEDKQGKSWKEFKKEVDSYVPTWWENYILWPTERWFKDTRYFFKIRVPGYFQRARYGFAHEDIWDLDRYLSSVISKSVGELKRRTHSYPNEKGMTFNKWKKILLEIERGFSTWEKLDDLATTSKEIKKLERQFQKGAKLFIKYYFALWD